MNQNRLSMLSLFRIESDLLRERDFSEIINDCLTLAGFHSLMPYHNLVYFLYLFYFVTLLFFFFSR